MTRYSRPLAIALISASTLSYEILLVRIFAIEQFHHFAYMAIGVAMLGFGASGTLLALAGRRPEAQLERWYSRSALATPLALIASATLVHLVPLDATQLLWDSGQWPRLAAVYLLLALPFGVGSLLILLSLTLEPERAGTLYGASFLGAGLGTALAVAVLWLALPNRALAAPALVAALGALAAQSGVKIRYKAAAWAIILFAAAVYVKPLWRLQMIPYKGLPQVEAYPQARRIAERSSPLGWVVAVEADAFRHAPGLSLAFRGTFPRQAALFVDGEVAGAASDWGGNSTARALLDWLPTAMPYALGKPEGVLVLGAGDGMEVWSALAHGADRVVASELNPQLVELGAWSTDASPVRGGPAPVDWVIGDARAYVARSEERFELITLGAGHGLGAAAAGVHALNEDFLHTVEAYVSYLEHLTDNGVLSITRWLTVPPRSNVRVILTVAEALRRAAPAALADGMVVARSWATSTVLVKPSGFAPEEVAKLKSWAELRRFDLDWYPGTGQHETQFNVLDEPTLFEAMSAAVAGTDSISAFVAAYPFHVAVATDSRPYPHHFLRARSLLGFLRGNRGAMLPFAEWGYVALVATLAQSVLFAAVLMLVPAALRAGEMGRGGWWLVVVYFASIGFAYLAAEVAAIQQLNLLLGHPVYAVAAVLSAFLVCSGIGSIWSDRRPARSGWHAGVVIALLLSIYAALLLFLIHQLQPLHLAIRALTATLVLAPLAFLMGLPFPLGLRVLTGEGAVAWAWAANGFASVVATPLAALIALDAGSPVLFLLAAAAYAGAGLTLRRAARRSGAVLLQT
ncbi:MAG: hypothetical protein JSU87_02380 [Gemmatimonadota bacterium]|nr:MAG: hypothetical protein JSU87_02380 [Gemmatimonadota bacterium]